MRGRVGRHNFNCVVLGRSLCVIKARDKFRINVSQRTGTRQQRADLILLSFIKLIMREVKNSEADPQTVGVVVVVVCPKAQAIKFLLLPLHILVPFSKILLYSGSICIMFGARYLNAPND